jgi:hypothetical protein
MNRHFDEWLAELERETAQARERAIAALEAFEVAVHELSVAAGAALWVRSSQADGRWDRRVPVAITGTVAPSSGRVSANSEPLRVAALVGYLREALEPPEPEPAAVFLAETSTAA